MTRLWLNLRAAPPSFQATDPQTHVDRRTVASRRSPEVQTFLDGVDKRHNAGRRFTDSPTRTVAWREYFADECRTFGVADGVDS